MHADAYPVTQSVGVVPPKNQGYILLDENVNLQKSGALLPSIAELSPPLKEGPPRVEGAHVYSSTKDEELESIASVSDDTTIIENLSSSLSPHYQPPRNLKAPRIQDVLISVTSPENIRSEESEDDEFEYNEGGNSRGSETRPLIVKERTYNNIDSTYVAHEATKTVHIPITVKPAGKTEVKVHVATEYEPLLHQDSVTQESAQVVEDSRESDNFSVPVHIVSEENDSTTSQSERTVGSGEPLNTEGTAEATNSIIEESPVQPSEAQSSGSNLQRENQENEEARSEEASSNLPDNKKKDEKSTSFTEDTQSSNEGSITLTEEPTPGPTLEYRLNDESERRITALEEKLATVLEKMKTRETVIGQLEEEIRTKEELIDEQKKLIEVLETVHNNIHNEKMDKKESISNSEITIIEPATSADAQLKKESYADECTRLRQGLERAMMDREKLELQNEQLLRQWEDALEYVSKVQRQLQEEMRRHSELREKAMEVQKRHEQMFCITRDFAQFLAVMFAVLGFYLYIL